MPQVKFEKQISLSPDDAFKKLVDLLENVSELKKVDPDVKVNVNNEKMCVDAKGSKISGQIQIEPSGSQSIVKIDFNIPWTYAPFKSIIQSKLEEKLSELC